MAILATDIGNSNIVIGLFEGQDLLGTLRVPTHGGWTEASLSSAVRDFLAGNQTDPSRIEGSIVTSVVPDAVMVLAGAIRHLAGCDTCIVHTGMDFGIRTDRYDTKNLGADRLVDLAAALTYYGAPAAVWDLGTATTLSAADGDRNFIGGMICPGIQLGLTALHEHTAKLPLVEPGPADSLLGLDTTSNMLSGTAAAAGILVGAVSDRMIREYHLDGLHIVVTGGLGRLILPWTGRDDIVYDPSLQLRGMAAIWYRNQKKL